jgi:hypothetical protein
MSTKKETLPTAALAVLRFHQEGLGPDLFKLVEAVFRLAYYMGRNEGLYLHKQNFGRPK